MAQGVDGKPGSVEVFDGSFEEYKQEVLQGFDGKSLAPKKKAAS